MELIKNVYFQKFVDNKNRIMYKQHEGFNMDNSRLVGMNIFLAEGISSTDKRVEFLKYLLMEKYIEIMKETHENDKKKVTDRYVKALNDMKLFYEDLEVDIECMLR